MSPGHRVRNVNPTGITFFPPGTGYTYFQDLGITPAARAQQYALTFDYRAVPETAASMSKWNLTRLRFKRSIKQSAVFVGILVQKSRETGALGPLSCLPRWRAIIAEHWAG